jgi:SAM-dependent methyltransferase
MSGIIDHFGKHLPRLVKCFREGGGIPYSEYRPEFTCHMDATWRRIYDELLISGFLGRINGLTERLAAGIGVVDVGCGSGHAVNVMAREFPRSRFVGYDLAEDAIANGRAITATIRPGATSPRSLSKRPRGSRWWI